MTGESHWYYADFRSRIDLLARSLAQGLGYQGERTHQSGEDKGEPSAHLPPTAFVSYSQNHDQSGNRPFGERLTSLAPRQAVRSLAAINILSPHIPLLFMGEEWGTRQPFTFFSDMGDELGEKIKEGRAREFQGSPDAANGSRRPPDAMAEETFLAAKLNWDDRSEDLHADWLSLYRKLLRLRRDEISPRLAGIEGYAGHYEIIANRAVTVRWKLADGSVLTLIANLSPEPLDGVDVWTIGRLIWLEGIATGTSLEPWCVVVAITDAENVAA